MRDVAALAGVSLKTVSRVVNREPGVRPELAARVARAAEQLDYRPDLTASNLRRADRRTATLGLLVEDVGNEFASAINRGVEEVARERGVAVIAASVDRDPALERERVDTFASRRVDALILEPTGRDQGYLAVEVQRGWPIIAVDRLATGIDIDQVVSNNLEATRDGVRHLLDLGHRRIAFLGGASTLSTAEERHRGFIEAMAAAGATVRREWVHRDLIDSDEAREALTTMLATDDRPTAIFAAQNLLTIGAVRALREHGLQHEIALVGFDDFLTADLLEPAVTVVAQDPLAIGRLAAELAFARMDDPDRPTQVHIVPATLITRGSGEIPPARSPGAPSPRR